MFIRTATLADAQNLLNIYTYYVEHTAITFEYEVPTVEEFRRRISHTLEKYPYLVAEEDGHILGYAYAGPFKGRKAYDWSVETSIYVDHDGKRKGTGKALLNALEDTLKKQHIVNVNACISNPEEEDEYLTFDSIRFHEKMGYQTVGVFHKCGYKFDRWYNMLWMEKMIGEHVSPMPEMIPFPELSD